MRVVECFEAADGAGHGDHMGAFVGISQRRGRTKAARGARDQRDASL